MRKDDEVQGQRPEEKDEDTSTKTTDEAGDESQTPHEPIVKHTPRTKDDGDPTRIGPSVREP